MTIYSSFTLPNDGKSIRLLTIEPSRNYNSLVNCALRVAEIHRGLEYEALSYCWGDPTVRDKIHVNGEETFVTKNLAAALHALREPTEPRTLWIDAICINQEDLVEKAYQVPLMTLIYRKCSKTIIWLGQSDKDSRKAFDLLQKGTKEYPQILSTVLRRAWFRRIWIVQEVATAPRALVQCGKDSIEWDDLAAVVALVPQLGSMVNPRSEGEYKHLHPAFYPRILDLSRKKIQGGDLFNLHDALRSFQPFDATLPVDKVFGVLGLLKDPSLVEVDYTLSPREVYAKVTFDMLKHTKSLDIFLDCLQNANGPRIPGLPSWVPDWSSTDAPLDNPMSTVTAKEVFHASRDTQLDDIIRCSGGILTLQGQLIGEIADLGEPIPSIPQLRKKYWPEGHLIPHRRAFELSTEAVGVLNSWKATICRRNGEPDRSLSDNYQTGETLLEVLYHTLNSNGGPFPDVKSDREFTIWIHSIEFMISIFALYGRIVSKLPWFLAWIFSGPYFVSWSFIIGIRIFRKRFIIDAPMPHTDVSRQTWVIGRTDSNLIGLFPAPSLSSPDTVPSQVGDSIVIFKGGPRPYVIRRDGKCWKIIGNAYIHGIMYGAAFNESQCIDIDLV